MAHQVTQFIIGLHNFIIRLHNFSSGYAILVQVTISVGDNSKYWLTLVPSVAGVVCQVVYLHHSLSNELPNEPVSKAAWIYP